MKVFTKQEFGLNKNDKKIKNVMVATKLIHLI